MHHRLGQHRGIGGLACGLAWWARPSDRQPPGSGAGGARPAPRCRGPPAGYHIASTRMHPSPMPRPPVPLRPPTITTTHTRNSSLAAKPQEARSLGKSLHEPARYDFHGAGGGTAGLTATREDTAIELQLRYERDSVPHDEPHTNEATKQRSNEAIERGSEEQQSLL